MLTRHREYFKARSFKLDFSKRSLIMGVINLTPDSFSNDGRMGLYGTRPNLAYALKLIKDGADIIDIGGESSRPGAQAISIKEELRRIIPTIKTLSQKARVPISVDTYKPEVALAALEAGASIINTIKGLDLSKEMCAHIKKFNAGIILMHMKGSPLNMQKDTYYKNIIEEIKLSLGLSASFCLENGIKKDRIIIDPGIGFSKSTRGNLMILKNISKFDSLGFPILIGASRKSFIGEILDKSVDQRTWGDAAVVAWSIAQGASILRVHDVSKMKQVAQMTDVILRA